MRNAIIAVLAAGLAAAAATAQQAPPATQPAPAAAKADRIEPFLSVIREAEDYRLVMRAYARAAGIDRGDPRIHDAYMRRMLRFGLPKIANVPAMFLTKLDRSNGTAWGVVAYMHGRRGELTEAFTAAIRAAARLPDDPGILHNAGQLVAWYDADPSLPRAPDSVRRTLAQSRDSLAKKATFARAYKQIAEAYSKRAKRVAELERKLAAAQAAVNVTQRMALEVDSQLRDLNDEIDYRNKLIDQLWRDLRYYYGSGSIHTNPDGTVVVLPPRDRYYRRELHDRVRAEERAIEALRLKAKQIRREGEAVLGELSRKQKTVEQIRKEFGREGDRVGREFRWDPPAVDGVVTAELDSMPATTGPLKAKLPVDPESEASQRLELARLYLRHEMRDKAVQILHEVVDSYGATKAGKQARVLLTALHPGQ